MTSFAIASRDSCVRDVDEKFVVNLKFGIFTTGVDVGALNHASIEYTHAIILLKNVSLLQNYFYNANTQDLYKS